RTWSSDLVLNGFPLQHDVKSSTPSATLYFAELLVRLTSRIIRNPFLLGTDADTDAVRRAKTAVRQQLLSLEGRERALCEHAKL
ncbi:unnamed protein product, partial [Symbiodinium sp. CCMP2456]